MIILILLFQLLTWCVTVGPGHLRSSKSVLIGKSVRDFLFVIHCNYVPIFYRLRDITIYWSKMHFYRFTHRNLVQSPLRGSLWSRVRHAVSKTGVHRWLVKWLSGRTLVFDRRVFAVLCSTYSWRVTTYEAEPSAIGQPTRPTQPCILSGSINE